MVESVNTELHDLAVAFAYDLLRYAATLNKGVAQNILRDLEDKLAAKLAGAKPLTAFARKRTEDLLSFVREVISESFDELDKALLKEYRGLAEVVHNKQLDDIENQLKVKIFDNRFTAKTLKTLSENTLISGAPSSEWWERQARDTSQRFSDAIRQGILAGETNDEMVRRVRGTREGGFKDGILNTATRNAEALIRSSVSAVNNTVRLETLLENSELFSGIQQISTLDSRTSEICMAYSGKVWSLPDYKPLGHDLPFNGGPPRHWNCRSTLVPVLKSWEELGIQGLEEFAPSTRASIDGQISETITFDQWLKKKPIDFQEEMLGVEKSRLFREGKITLSDLVNSAGTRSLTLNQLKAKIRKQK